MLFERKFLSKFLLALETNLFSTRKSSIWDGIRRFITVFQEFIFQMNMKMKKPFWIKWKNNFAISLMKFGTSIVKEEKLIKLNPSEILNDFMTNSFIINLKISLKDFAKRENLSALCAFSWVFELSFYYWENSDQLKHNFLTNFLREKVSLLHLFDKKDSTC